MAEGRAGKSSFTRLIAGAYHNCGEAADGKVYCWGDNGYGQLSDNTTGYRPTPTAVLGGLLGE